MVSQALDAFIESNGIKKIDSNDVCCSSCAQVVKRSCALITDGYINLKRILKTTKCIENTEAYRMVISGTELGSKIKAFNILCSAWINHAEHIAKNNHKFRKDSPRLERDSKSQKSNVIFLRQAKESFKNKHYSDESEEVYRILRSFGFQVKLENRIPKNKTLEIYLTGRSFFNDAYHHAFKADSLLNELLASCDELQSLIGDSIMDRIVSLSGKNRAWLIHSKRSVIGKSLSGEVIFTESEKVKASKKVRSIEATVNKAAILKKDAKVIPIVFK